MHNKTPARQTQRGARGWREVLNGSNDSGKSNEHGQITVQGERQWVVKVGYISECSTENKYLVLYAVGRPQSAHEIRNNQTVDQKGEVRLRQVSFRCRSVILIDPIFPIIGPLVVDITDSPEDLAARPCSSVTEKASSVISLMLNLPEYIIGLLGPVVPSQQFASICLDICSRHLIVAGSSSTIRLAHRCGRRRGKRRSTAHFTERLGQ